MSNGDRNHVRQLFNTRSHSWREAGLARQLSRRAVKRARIQALVMVPLLVAILVVYDYRHELFGDDFDVSLESLARRKVHLLLGRGATLEDVLASAPLDLP